MVFEYWHSLYAEKSAASFSHLGTDAYDTLSKEIFDPMEQIITKLLRDFEDGFLNRRQLIQNLALAFSAALGGKALAQTPAGKPASASASPIR